MIPVLEVLLDPALRDPARERFVDLALADTDRRVAEGLAVAPSFLLACLLWHEVVQRWAALQAAGEAPFPALQRSVDAVFDARIGDISGRGKLAADMREIWLMQPRFERRFGSGPFSLVEQARYRAGFDFLRLRADAGDASSALADWWEDFALGSDEDRQALIADAKTTDRAPARGDASAPRAAQGQAHDDLPADEPAAEGAPAKKRRRRRRPKGRGEGSAAPVSE